MNKKLLQESLMAERNAVQSLLETLPSGDILSRGSLEERLYFIEDQLEELGTKIDTNASASLFFGGKPVVGSRGIDASFSACTLGHFQDLVAKLLVSDVSNNMAPRGPVPARKNARLHITDVVHGSFGFHVEELADQHRFVDTSLKKAVEHAVQLIKLAGDEEDEPFDVAIAAIDQRAFRSLRKFFKTLSVHEANMRVVSGDLDISFDDETVNRATERTQATSLEEDDNVILHGELFGILPDGHKYEFKPDDGPVMRGGVTKVLEFDELKTIATRFVGRRCIARFRQVIVKRGATEKITHVLLGVSGVV